MDVDVVEYQRLLAANAALQARVDAAEERARAAEESPEKAMMLKKIQELREAEQAEGKEIYYENQAETAKEVVMAVNNESIVFQMVVAPCQSGKTGCMLASIEMLLQSESTVNPNNIFVITGLSDIEWVLQTRKRMPFIADNIIHRGQLSKSVRVLKDIKDAVIIIDECQIACKKDMSLDKLLEKSGLKDLLYLKKNNVNIVEFSATPNSTLNDMERWETCSVTHAMNPGQGYMSLEKLLPRIHQSNDLFIEKDPVAGLPYDSEDKRNRKIKPAIDAIKQVKGVIQTSYASPRFHIIRTPNGDKAETVIGRFKELCGDEYAYKRCFGDEMQLMDEVNKVPEKHTFLFIKEKARCAVTFVYKDRIGILYERVPKNPMDDVIVQGLAGRACGYDVDDGIIVFTNVDSIHRYLEMMNTGFTKRDAFTFTGHKSKKASHLHPSTYKNTQGEVSEHKDDDDLIDDIIMKEFNTYKDAQTYYRNLPKEHFGGRGRGLRDPTKRDEKGFLTATIRGRTKVYSYDEVVKEKRCGLNATSKHRFYPCYHDTDDKDTLTYVIIHKDVE